MKNIIKNDSKVKILDEPKKEIGLFLKDLVSIMRSRIKLIAEKKRIEIEHQLKQFEKELEAKMNNIPEENIQMPNSRFIFSAMEATQHVISEEKIREMFTTLIASSVDSRYEQYTHIAFVEMLKQMLPTDAIVFEKIVDNVPVPVCKIFHLEDSKAKETIKLYARMGADIDLESPIFDYPASGNDITGHYMRLDELEIIDYKIEESLDNLSRLGLINIDYSSKLPDECYNMFLEDGDIKSRLSEDKDNKLICGTCYLTRLGKSFAKVCLD